MHTQLIPVVAGHIGAHACLTVDGRTLHAFLEVGKRFADWINERIQQYGFREAEDFEQVFPDSGKNPLGGRPSKDYRLSLDMAKELAMVERTPRGREARRYFIACEAELLALKGEPAPGLPAGPFTPARTLMAQLDAALLRELRLISPPLAQAYLIEMGITPEHVAQVLGQHGVPFAGAPSLPGIDVPPRAAPLDYLRERLERMADFQTDTAWLFRAPTWEAVCLPYDARDTLVHLRDLGYLRCQQGRFTSLGPRQRGGRRGVVFAVLKTLAERPVDVTA